MNVMKTLVVAVVAILLTASPVFADLHVAMHDGRVSILATNVTVKQILTEWARLGETRIVNVERIPGGLVTLVLENVTEAQALEVLLRPLSGYIAAPRQVAAANLSAYDRIIIMPTLAEVRPMAPLPPAAAASSQPPPPVYQPPPAPATQAADADQNPEPVQPANSTLPFVPNVPNAPEKTAEPMRNPPPNTFMKGLEVGRPMEFRSPQRVPVTSTGSPIPPVGVAVPGMIAATPQTGQPGQAGQAPGQPVRRPGGP
jgi:hypothetical protein